MTNKLVITIMAAGEGKRMNSSIPKVLHLFKGEPMLVRIIKEAYLLNPYKIIIITGKYDSLIKLTLSDYINSDIFKKLVFIIQQNPKGTGDAIKQTLDYYDDESNVLILNGDMPLIKSKLLNLFIESYFTESKIMVSKIDNPYGYGRILFEDDNFIGIKEEKDCSIEEKKIDIINVGIYYFNTTILKKYIPLINDDNAQIEFYLTDIIKVIKSTSNLNIKTYLIEDNYKYQILGVNTQKELFDLENQYSKKELDDF